MGEQDLRDESDFTVRNAAMAYALDFARSCGMFEVRNVIESAEQIRKFLVGEKEG